MLVDLGHRRRDHVALKCRELLVSTLETQDSFKLICSDLALTYLSLPHHHPCFVDRIRSIPDQHLARAVVPLHAGGLNRSLFPSSLHSALRGLRCALAAAFPMLPKVCETLRQGAFYMASLGLSDCLDLADSSQPRLTTPGQKRSITSEQGKAAIKNTQPPISTKCPSDFEQTEAINCPPQQP